MKLNLFRSPQREDSAFSKYIIENFLRIEKWANRDFEPWNIPTLQNGWLNWGGGFNDAGYRLENGRVWLRGTLNAGGPPTAATAFTLPVGYRPLFTTQLVGKEREGAGNVNVTGIGVLVTTGGAVQIQNHTATQWAALDSLSFPVD